MTKRVILVGAGPGDPELISVKGLKAISNAKVVLYDALVHEDILSFIPKTAERIFVGKRKGICQTPQEKINDLLVEKANEYGEVVRLKGGDPFIFGRGHEELAYVKGFGIETDVIPGISSAYSVPELSHIPLTRRGVSESFWVVTATTKEHQLSSDIELAACSTATVVILMGMHKIAEIVKTYQDLGRGDTPVAIIQNGSNENEQKGFGTLDSIEEVISDKGLGAPAIIVIGEVVTLYPNYENELKNSITESII